jgi:PIN domain nuclease of toxin-antitoxin system
MTALLDTHAWIWWATEDRRLSRRAKSTIERARRSDNLGLSAISIWEVAKKIETGQLQLDRPLDEWLDAALAFDGLQVVELTRTVLVEACRLPGTFHGDPADQLMVATARQHAAALVTADSRIRKYGHVKSIW